MPSSDYQNPDMPDLLLSRDGLRLALGQGLGAKKCREHLVPLLLSRTGPCRGPDLLLAFLLLDFLMMQRLVRTATGPVAFASGDRKPDKN